VNRPLAAALGKLLAAPEELRASALTASQRLALDQLAQRTGALSRMPRGSGSVYCVRQRSVLQEHLTALRPMAPEAIPPELPERAANIARTRDSKGRRHRHAQCYLLVKTLGSPVLWRRDGVAWDLAAASRAPGAAAFALSAEDAWYSESPLWLVENQALFDRLDWFPGSGPATVAYYAGQLSGELQRWLAHRPRAPQVMLFADYDGIGLLNYARLRAATQGQCSFWLMPDWPELLQRFGNRELWQRTLPDFQRALTRLEQQGMDSAISPLCQAMAIEGAALEHEAVWLNGPEARSR
jgi:hypothetical protein